MSGNAEVRVSASDAIENEPSQEMSGTHTQEMHVTAHPSLGADIEDQRPGRALEHTSQSLTISHSFLQALLAHR